MERTLILLKPDCVHRRLVGEILSRFERKGLRLTALKLVSASKALAEKHGVRTIAFPAISTGVYSFPLERATKIAVTETRRFLETHPAVEKVIFVCFGKIAYDCYVKTLGEMVGRGEGSKR